MVEEQLIVFLSFKNILEVDLSPQTWQKYKFVGLHPVFNV